MCVCVCFMVCMYSVVEKSHYRMRFHTSFTFYGVCVCVCIHAIVTIIWRPGEEAEMRGGSSGSCVALLFGSGEEGECIHTHTAALGATIKSPNVSQQPRLNGTQIFTKMEMATEEKKVLF